MWPKSPEQTLQVNALFACNLLTTKIDGQHLEAIITLAMSGIPYTRDDAFAIVYSR